jgi:type 1 fimbria pilin
MTATTTATTQATLFTIPLADCDSIKALVVANDGTNIHSTELLIVHDGTTASAVEYGIVHTSTDPLCDYEVSISGTNLIIQGTPAAATSTTYKMSATLI